MFIYVAKNKGCRRVRYQLRGGLKMTEVKQTEVVEEKLFTQSELDEIVKNRLARLHKKYERAILALVKSVTSEGGE